MSRQNPRTPFTSQVGARIRYLRLERGLPLEQLAARAGLCRRRLDGIERGTLTLNVETMHALAYALRASAFDLLNCDLDDARGELVEMLRHSDKETGRKVEALIATRVHQTGTRVPSGLAAVDEALGAHGARTAARRPRRARRCRSEGRLESSCSTR